MRRLPFNELKATQAASRLLRANRGKMNYQLLIKHLYDADREALLRWGHPITTEPRYVSMPEGPVISTIYSIIMEKNPPAADAIWRQYISDPKAYVVQAVKDPGEGELSRAEEALLDEIFKRHRAKGRIEMKAYVHTFPEWRDPKLAGGITEISIGDILKAGGKTDAEIEAIESELESLAVVERMIGRN